MNVNRFYEIWGQYEVAKKQLEMLAQSSKRIAHDESYLKIWFPMI